MNEDQKRAQKRVVKSHPKASKKILKQVQKAMQNLENDNSAQLETTVNDQEAAAGLMVSNHTPPVEIDENGVTAEPFATPLDDENRVSVERNQLHLLIEQNKNMKTEIGQLVGLFQFFMPLVNGGNAITLAMQIPKLLGNKEIAAQVQAVAPIIEKYTITP